MNNRVEHVGINSNIPPFSLKYAWPHFSPGCLCSMLLCSGRPWTSEISYHFLCSFTIYKMDIVGQFGHACFRALPVKVPTYLPPSYNQTRLWGNRTHKDKKKIAYTCMYIGSWITRCCDGRMNIGLSEKSVVTVLWRLNDYVNETYVIAAVDAFALCSVSKGYL